MLYLGCGLFGSGEEEVGLMPSEMFAITAEERRVIQKMLASYSSLLSWADKVITMHGTGDERHQDLTARIAEHRQAFNDASSVQLRGIEQPETEPREIAKLPEMEQPVGRPASENRL